MIKTILTEAGLEPDSLLSGQARRYFIELLGRVGQANLQSGYRPPPTLLGAEADLQASLLILPHYLLLSILITLRSEHCGLSGEVAEGYGIAY